MIRMEWAVLRFVRAAVAAGSVLMVMPTAGAAPIDAAAPVPASAAENGKGAGKADKCVTRREYRRLDAKGKNASSPRQVRRIIGYDGKRVSLSRAAGYRWEIRKYARCNSEILHVYVNYRGNRAYRKAW